MGLRAHQAEVAAVARQRNALVCCADKVGKTFIGCELVREALARCAGATGDARRFVVTVAATAADARALVRELARFFLEPVCGDMAQDEEDALKASTQKKWESDNEWVREQLLTHRLLVLSPHVVLRLLRSQLLLLQEILLLFVESSDQVQACSPLFFRTMVEQQQQIHSGLRAYVTSRLPASKIFADTHNDALLQLVQAVNVLPMLDRDLDTDVRLAPIVGETLDCPTDNAPSTARDFLMGKNRKKVNVVDIYRWELSMGNSAAVYDEKRKEERVHRFLLDAESVFNHLGLWCLIVFAELELQTNLQACLVDDPDNINHRRKRAIEQCGTLGLKEDGEIIGDEPEAMDIDLEPLHGEDIENNNGNIEQQPKETLTFEETLNGFLASANEVSKQRVNRILDTMKWLREEASLETTNNATPRLKKASALVRQRLAETTDVSEVRCWVFIERRCQARVVSEYMTAMLKDLSLPPACCLLGNRARIAGAFHFSTCQKVMTMFRDGKTNVLVTTSIGKRNPLNEKVKPPPCDLIVVMDELTEAQKLYGAARRAKPSSGSVVYIHPATPEGTSKFSALRLQMQDCVRMDEEQRAVSGLIGSTRSHDQCSGGQNGLTSTPDVSVDNVVGSKPETKVPTTSYEVVHEDTGAVLNLATSVTCLSDVCDTLPGIDTYDRRPEYTVKRHLLSHGMSQAKRARRKKLQRYNCRLEDKIDACKAAAIEGNDEEESLFEYSAYLRLPGGLGVKREYNSPRVSSDTEARAIVAFKACKELLANGRLDRHFRSVKHCIEKSSIRRQYGNASLTECVKASNANVVDDIVPKETQQEKLADMMTQNSYDLPPVSARELGLRPIRSLLEDDTLEPDDSISMHLYGLCGLHFAILTSNPLQTGGSNSSWMVDFAIGDVFEAKVHPASLHKSSLDVVLSKDELRRALKFHLITMRMACMSVNDAMREVKFEEDEIWKEFSEHNDKGYLVVPSVHQSESDSYGIDWGFLDEVVTGPLLKPLWPLSADTKLEEEDLIMVPTNRRNVSFVVQGMHTQTVADVWADLKDEANWNRHYKKRAVPGKPRLGRWHTRLELEEADQAQLLIHGIQVPEIVPLIRRVMQRRNEEAAVAQPKSRFHERYLVPQCTSRLIFSKTRYFQAMGIVPLLYDFERKCQLANLMNYVGVPLEMSLLSDATTKPNYERLEILGDTYLKLETTWYFFESRRDITEEGQLTQFRRDIIRNDRLNQFAMTVGINKYILYPTEIEQHPFECWKPSCMGLTPKTIVVPSKWIADVVEAVCGAYLVGAGEFGGRHYLKWIGVSVPDQSHTLARPYYPDCFPNDLDPLAPADCTINFTTPQFQDIPTRLAALQGRLKYKFRDHRLLLEAVTHPSIGVIELKGHEKDSNSSHQEMWKGDYERLEFLGDAIIEYLSLSYAYITYSSWGPGPLTQWKSATISNDALGKTAISCFGIDECIIAGTIGIDSQALSMIDGITRKYCSDDASSCRLRPMLQFEVAKKSRRKPNRGPMAKSFGDKTTSSLPKVFGDVFESLVAAVFMDSGRDMQVVRDVFLGSLLDTVGRNAHQFVSRGSGLPDEEQTEEQQDLEELPFLSDDEMDYR
ncbi:TPA: hypothetical protein N0F65_009223 [Lagenidium giganteum]|uniref:RNase III domain-containing protein n=1 Tax=Lagenidium giganteum TaxID=4803 RepID=A0AAV2YRD2_9STRA|nr:TPA: hypothetical protein N0F65_009223 [Lagenidium giganteum]